MKLALAASLALAIGLASAAQAQEKLEIKDREGTTATRTTAKTHQLLSIAGMDVETSSSLETTTTSVVEKPGADGTVRMKQTIDAIKATLALPGDIKAAFDSDKPDAKSDNPDVQGLIDLWHAMKGATYTVVIGPDHKVRAVEGNLEAIIAKAQGQFAEQAKDRISKEALKQEVEQARDVLPDKLVKKGDRWQRTRALHAGAGQLLTFDTYYEYAGTVEKGGKTLDKIDSFIGGVTYSLDPNSPLPLKLLKSDLKIDSSMGSVLFDREKGQIVEATSTTRITGPITFSVNGQELPAKLDLTMETGSSVK
jgi:hypothetical protein